MCQFDARPSRWKFALLGLCLCWGTGCQVDVAGQTLPSPYYQQDDIQYFPPGPKMKVSNEATAQKEFAADQALLAR